MSTSTTETTAPARPAKRGTKGFGEFVVVAVTLGLAIFLTVNTATMEVRGKELIGPQFFPAIVAGVLYVVSILLTIQILRGTTVENDDDPSLSADFSPQMLDDLGDIPHEAAGTRDSAGRPEVVVTGVMPKVQQAQKHRMYSDWKTIGLVLLSLVVFTIGLVPVGWLIMAALLFWGICVAFGSRKYLMDLAIGFVFSAVFQLVFNGLLGLNLPSGFLEGLL